MATNIYIMTHKNFSVPSLEGYVPLQVGKAGKKNLGYLGDDTGDNISDLNFLFGELTGVYWLWKNMTEKINVGICHYRRFFLDEAGELITIDKCEDLLKTYDVIVPKVSHVGKPYREHYIQAHGSQDLLIEEVVIKQLYPEDYSTFKEVMAGDEQYFGNLMIMSERYFNEYCNWLFSIFSEMTGLVDVSGRDAYHTRLFGFLSEELLMVFIKSRGLRTYECQVGIFDEKAETKELKKAVALLLLQGQPEEAAKIFYKVLEDRPDLRLSDSDLKGELPDIHLILQICLAEKAAGENSLLSYSNKLPALIESVRTLRQNIMEKSEHIEFLDKNNEIRLSDAAITILKKICVSEIV